MEKIMKKLVIMTLLLLSMSSAETRGGSAAGAFTGSLIGSSMGTAISNRRSGNGDCDHYEVQIEKYEEKNEQIRKENNRLIQAINPHRGLLPELEDDFKEWIDDFEEEF